MAGIRAPAIIYRCVVGLFAAALCHPLCEERVHPFDDRALGAEVLHEAQGLAAHALLQAAHLAHVGAAESVDGLLRVADHEELSLFRCYFAPFAGSLSAGRGRVGVFGKEHGDFSLDEVGVLRLVDEQVGEASAEVVAGVEVVPQHVSRPHQQVVEAGATLRLAVVRVRQHEFPERVQQGHQCGGACLCDGLGDFSL